MDVKQIMRAGAAACAALSTNVHAGLVINEIMNNPAAVSDSAGEWLELFNPAEYAVDLTGWTLSDLGSNLHVVAGPLIAAAGGYLILARSADSAVNGGITPDYVYGSDVTLGNSMDALVLSDAGGTEVDRVEWDGGPLFPDPSGASMALLDPALDNALGTNWVATPSDSPFGAGDFGTPGAANFAVAAPAPVPEPGTWLLFVAGVATLLAARRRPAAGRLLSPSSPGCGA